MSESSSAIPSPNPTSPAWSFYVDNLQTFNLTNVYGNSTQFTVWDISQFNYFIMATITIQGFVLGFTSMLLILLTILTPFHKAKRPIFIINYIALVLACMKAILVVSYYSGTKFIWGWGEEKLGAYAQYSFSLQVGPGIFSAVLTIPLYACVLFSLILQVRVVFAMEPITRKVITVLLTLSALVLLGLQTAWQAYGIQEEINPNKPLNLNNNTWNAFHIGFPLFISISCLLFLYKLGITIYRRRNMGFKQFGPLQVLVIMFGQCLIIPGTPPLLTTNGGVRGFITC